MGWFKYFTLGALLGIAFYCRDNDFYVTPEEIGGNAVISAYYQHSPINNPKFNTRYDEMCAITKNKEEYLIIINPGAAVFVCSVGDTLEGYYLVYHTVYPRTRPDTNLVYKKLIVQESMEWHL